MSDFTDPITGADAVGDPTASELGRSEFAVQAPDRDDAAVSKTGTTTVGITTDHGSSSRPTDGPRSAAGSSRTSPSGRSSRSTRRQS
jgi:hypothetical protein